MGVDQHQLDLAAHVDVPMAQGIIDFARAHQMTIITPFCLAGATAPITVARPLTLQHAEALMEITLAQLSRIPDHPELSVKPES